MRLLLPKLFMCAIASSLALYATAEVVFDGSIGSLPAGTIRGGDFAITESDGQLSGTNLFHSFDRFNVNSGESATFSHSTPNVLNIIGRVTGDSGSLIRGPISVVQQSGNELAPGFASLWLINPSGIVIGEGAALNSNGGFRFSSANEIGFSNGEAFYSHDVTQNSTLSFADPVAFGFLAGDSLPDTITPGPVVVGAVDDPAAPVFLSAFDLALVGANADPDSIGLSIAGQPPNGDSDGLSSTTIAGTRIALHALGPTGRVFVTPVFTPGQVFGVDSGSGLEISSSDIQSNDFGGVLPPSPSLITGQNVSISDSAVFAVSDGTSNSLAIGALNQTSISSSILVTRTLSDVDAGDLAIVGGSILSSDTILLSEVSEPENPAGVMEFGDAGDITLVSLQNGIRLVDPDLSSGTDSVQSAGGTIRIESMGDISLEGTRPNVGIINFTGSGENAGDIVIQAAGDLSIGGTFTTTSTSIGVGDSGNILLTGDSVSIEGLDANQTSTVMADTTGEGGAGEIRIQATQGLRLANAEITSTSAGGNGQAGGIVIQGADLELNDSFLLSSTNSNNPLDAPGSIELISSGDLSANRLRAISNTGNQAPAGRVDIDTGGSVLLTQTELQTAASSSATGPAGEITINADGSFTLQGEAAVILTSHNAVGDAGNISVQAQDITLRDSYRIGSTAVSGIAGDITLSGDRITGGTGEIDTTSGGGGGGNLNLVARELRLTGSADGGSFYTVDSFSSDSDGNGGSITLGDPANPAELILVNRSAFTAGADQGDGGRINVNADTFLSAATSIFRVTSNSGTDGVLNVNAPQQDISASVVELAVPLLDQTDLIQDLCAKGTGSRSSLVLAESDAQLSAPSDYFVSSAQESEAISGSVQAAATGIQSGRSLGCAR